MIVNNPTDSASPPTPNPPQTVAKRGASTYQYGPPPPPRTHTPWTQDQYQVIYGNHTGQQRYKEVNEYGDSHNETLRLSTQYPSTYQYGPPPLPSRISAPTPCLYPQQLSAAGVGCSPRAQADRPLNRDTQYEHETETEKRQVLENGENYLGEQRPERNLHRYAAPISVSAVPPVYTPYPTNEWDEWE